MNELSFLIDLILNHKLPKALKEVISNRIREVEARPMTHFGHQQPAMQVTWGNNNNPGYVGPSPPTVNIVPIPVASDQPNIAVNLEKQAPSTIAALAKHGLVTTSGPIPQAAPAPPPVQVIAQTPQTSAALAERNAHIKQAMSGKPFAGETSPRKW